MRVAELQALSTLWQERLNLREWNITTRWGKGMKNLHGQCWWDAENLVAVVTICKYSRDKELTLVHELLHLVLEGHEEFKGPNVIVERAINRIAAALVGVK